MDDHDKILCERLATTVDHGICKCVERHRIAALEAELAAARLLVREQAEDDGLWFRAELITEEKLQIALRRLHAAIEGRE